MLETLIPWAIVAVMMAAGWILWHWVTKGIKGSRPGRFIKIALGLVVTCVSAAGAAILLLHPRGPIKWGLVTFGVILTVAALCWVWSVRSRIDDAATSKENPDRDSATVVPIDAIIPVMPITAAKRHVLYAKGSRWRWAPP